jgi:hypothetical protein
MNRSEAAYLRALQWYPREWRAAHEQVMLSTLLDQAEASGRVLPSIGERLNLARHGLRERLRTSRGRVPEGVRDRAATISLGTAAALAATLLFVTELGLPADAELSAGMTLFGPFASPVALGYFALLLSFVLAMIGLERTSRVTIVGACAILVGTRIAADSLGMWLRPSWTLVWFLLLLGGLALIGRIGGTPRTAGWLGITAAVALPILLSPMMFTGTSPSRDFLLGTWPVELALGWLPFVVLGIAALLNLSGHRNWTGAVLIAALPWLALALVGWRDYGEIADMFSTGAVLIAGVGAVLGVLRLFGLKLQLRRVGKAAPGEIVE